MYVDDLKIMLNKQIMKDVPRIIIILSNLPILERKLDKTVLLLLVERFSTAYQLMEGELNQEMSSCHF